MNIERKLFTPLKLGNILTKNRVFLSPMGEGKASPNGNMTEEYFDHYTEIAKGGTAVITPGVVCVDYPQGKSTINTFKLDSIKQSLQLATLVDSVHRYGALFIPQLHHAGFQTDPFTIEGKKLITPSDQTAEHYSLNEETRAMGFEYHEPSTAEVKELIQKFISSAKYAEVAGCDGVTLHGAHGYLIGAFLSGDINKRTDEYGGSFENRARFLLEIAEGIKKNCGPEFILGARIPGAELTTNGLTEEECIKVAQLLEEIGVDYLDISWGTIPYAPLLVEPSNYKEGNRIHQAQKIKQSVKHIKVGTVGSLRTPEYCNDLIEEGIVDFISIGRGLICDPEWVNKAQANEDQSIRPCLNCNDGCLGGLMAGEGIHCVINPEFGRSRFIKDLEKPEKPKKVMIVGGGLAGMQAAISSAKKGNEVTIFEGSDRLGGQLLIAGVPPHKHRILQANEWFISEVEKQNITVLLNTRVTMDVVNEFKPDSIIYSVGSQQKDKNIIPGADTFVNAWEFISGNVETPRNLNVTVIGGGIVGCEVAEMLIETKNKVTILEAADAFAKGLEAFHGMELQKTFEANSVDVLLKALPIRMDEDKLYYSLNGSEKELTTDLVILAIGQKPAEQELLSEIYKTGIPTQVIGDAKWPRKFKNATHEGFFVGISV